MTAERVTPEQAKAVARTLFTQMYRDQEVWFDLAWDRFCTRGADRDRRVSPAEMSGLGVAGEANNLTLTMARQFADLAATFLIRSPIARSELLARLRKNQVRSGKPDAVIDWLMESAAQTLEQLSAANKVYVTTLRRSGGWTQNQSRSYAEATRELQSEEFDVIVNEPEHRVRVSDHDGIVPSPITAVAPMQRGMLWLTLTNVGGSVKHDSIGALFNIDVTERGLLVPEKDRVVNKVYQYPVALREMLGRNLYARVIQKGAGRANGVMREGWSFLWIRNTANERDSDLLQGIVGPARNPT